MRKFSLTTQMKFFGAFLAAMVMLLLPAKQSMAGIDPPVVQVLNGGSGQIVLNASMMVEDAKFFDVNYYGKLIKPYPVKNAIIVEVNEDLHKVIQGTFSATVRLRIDFVRSDSTTGTVNRDFTVTYNAGSNYVQKDYYVFDNCVRVEVEVIQLSKNVGWDAYELLKITNQLTPMPNYQFSCSLNTVQSVSDSAWAADTGEDELPVFWSPSLGADEYDLEWTYIDSSALESGRYGDPEDPDADLIFDNNASRVTITGTYYRIPLMYDNKGHLFYRVRSVQWQAGGGRNEADWSSGFEGGLGWWEYNGHERALNWQATTTYAEEGKRKTVIQYFDGSLRSRQTVTKDNSTYTTIVAENFYDYQGRPVIQVLPAPTMNTIIKYNHNFNVGLNSNIYDKYNYDTLSDPELYCNSGALPMDTISGASRYYSSYNPLVDSGFHKYIPDAEGYPFTEVEYTQDNTGRVSRQSGVGPTFRIGNGREAKYFYGTPDQRELDALFGTEVGDASHYFKTMVRDANGQYSVSYTDMHGRTVATALAGVPPAGTKLDTLASYTSAERTERLSDPASVVIKDLVMENKKGLLVSKAGYHTFSYKLNPQSLQKEGCTAEVCYECLYDLRITITDDCNNQKLGGSPFDTLVTNFTIGQIDTSCTTNSGGFEFTFVKWLEEGSYEVTKQLSVSKYGLDYYRDSIFLVTNTCKTLDSFINEQRQLLAEALECKPTCESCTDSLGSWEQFWLRFRQSTGIADTDTLEYKTMAETAYAEAVKECAALCDSAVSEYDDIRKFMLMDMTPSSGQYANVDNEGDTLSIFFSSADGFGDDDTTPIYQRVTHYLDEDGNAERVFDEASGTVVSPAQLSPEVFAQKFKLSWAEALLPFHPEYCKLQRYEQLKASHEWDRRFAAVDSWQEAMEKGYLNPTNDGSAPFSDFNGTGTLDVDPLATLASGHFELGLENGITQYRNVSGVGLVSMWSVATLTAMCEGDDLGCYNIYRTTSNAFNSDSMCVAELNMAWRAFRQMYLELKRKLVNQWINIPQAAPCHDLLTAAEIMAKGHQPHFGDAEGLLAANEVDLPTTEGEADAFEQAHRDDLNQYYATNCTNYATTWWQQLAPCNFTPADSARIVSRLVQICIEGSDQTHPYGASSVKPSSGYTFRSFEQFLTHYCDSMGIAYNEHCNAYLIPNPKPYNQQPALGNKLIYRPDSCECERLKFYRDQFGASGYSSWVTFMQQKYNVTLTSGQLEALMSLCQTNGLPAPECNYLEQPIYLPPALQCGTGDVCVGCETFEALDTEFRILFPGVTPAAGDSIITDSTQLKWNSLYEKFMNYRLGFVKSTAEYLAFADSCNLTISAPVDCDSLQDVLAEATCQYLSLSDSLVNTHQCGINNWILEGFLGFPNNRYRETEFTKPEAFADSMLSMPYDASIQHGRFWYQSQRAWCIENEYAIEARVRNPGGTDVDLYLNTGSINAVPTDGDENISVAFIPHTAGYYTYRGVRTYDAALGGMNFTDWRIVKLAVKHDRFQFYYEGQLLKEVMRDGNSYITAINGAQVQFDVAQTAQMDWVKVYGTNDSLMFYEEFDQFPTLARPDPKYLCPPPTCETYFTTFFNNRFGTQYSYEQIREMYAASCGVTDICGVISGSSSSCTYQKSYGGSAAEFARDVEETADGLIMAGETTSFGNGGMDAYVVKTDKRGNVLWSKTYGGAEDDFFYDIDKTFDGGFIATGITNSYHGGNREMYVVKMDSEGEVMWSRALGVNTANGEVSYNILQLSDSGYMISGMHNQAPGVNSWALVRLDASGNVVWGKRLGFNDSDDAGAVREVGDTLVFVGISHSTGLGNPYSFFDMVFMKLNKHDGAVHSVRSYDIDDRATWTGEFFPTTYGYMIPIVSANGWGSNEARGAVVKLSPHGDMIRVEKINTPGNNVAITSNSHPTSDGGYIMVQTEDVADNEVYWHKVNSAGALEWSNRVKMPGDQIPWRVLQLADGSFLTSGQHDGDYMLMKVNGLGKSNCEDSSLTIALDTLPWEPYTQSIEIDDTLIFSNINVVVVAENAATTTRINCLSAACTVPSITLCGRAEPVFPPSTLDSVDNCSDSTFFIMSKAQELYKVYRDSLVNDFDSSYIARCMQAYQFENFTVRHTVSEFHHTLYYYDQAGNLIKTVPPAGVRANYDSLWLDSVYSARLAGEVKLPGHELVTQYRYNTLNLVIAQHSPDGGKSEFWYDRLGRVVLSRNAKQVAESATNRYLYSYSLYDHLGRITEVGQIRDTAASTLVNDALTRNLDDFADWLGDRSHYRHQVTQSVYDVPFFTGTYNPLTVYQRNLRNRISYVSYMDTTGASIAYNNATFYSYDIHGNVDTLLQDYGLSTAVPNVMNANGNRWKKIIYKYDLISGKVNLMTYQRGYVDQWYHRFTYDAENRLTLAETSFDSIVWEKEARYEYYKHGPLARTVIGDQQVQGMDYAYTLQGWLKGINSTGGTSAHDIGADGLAGGVNQYTARDALGVTLNYFAGEYSAINGGVDPFPAYSSYLNNEYRPLYNGNISSVSVYNRHFTSGVVGGPMLFYNYRYDQLHRLTGMDVYQNFNSGTNSWSGMQLGTDSMMKERVTYDANGNITRYLRNAVSAFPMRMDSLTYSYYPGTNKLRRIRDIVPDNHTGSNSWEVILDIDNQSNTDNYVYDAIGNLVEDKAEQITSIKWNVYGKITEITRNSTAKVPITNIKYTYDALGNRIGKVFDLNGTKQYTWYVRDAQGNLLTTYTTTGNNANVDQLTLSLTERHLYGSSRVGMYTFGRDVDNNNGGPTTLQFYSGSTNVRGFKQYELTNHLGNVLAVLGDKKYGVSSGGSFIDYYNPHIAAANDYYPFGMPSRIATSNVGSHYRYGFNGQEHDWEVKGWQNQVEYEHRVYDPRIGKFLSVDPLTKDYPWYTPYQFAGNSPITNIDVEGAEPLDYRNNWILRSISVRRTGQVLGKSGILIEDPKLGLIDVDLFYDKWTKRTWFVHQDKTSNQYYYYEANDGNHSVMSIDARTNKLVGGAFAPFETQDAIQARLGADFADMLGIGMFAAVAAITGGIALEGMLTTYGANAVGRYIVEEVAEEVVENLTGIPVIMNPADILEKGYRAVIRSQVKDKLVEKYGKDVVKGPGSYTIKYADGTTYHGAGNLEEAITRAYKKSSKKSDDTVVSLDWTPSKSRPQQFRDEAKRIDQSGGYGAKGNNRNKQTSPGHRKYKDPANDPPGN